MDIVVLLVYLLFVSSAWYFGYKVAKHEEGGRFKFGDLLLVTGLSLIPVVNIFMLLLTTLYLQENKMLVIPGTQLWNRLMNFEIKFLSDK